MLVMDIFFSDLNLLTDLVDLTALNCPARPAHLGNLNFCTCLSYSTVEVDMIDWVNIAYVYARVQHSTRRRFPFKFENPVL